MHRFLILSILFWQPVFALQESLVANGTAGTLTIPAGAPFNAMGSMRIEMRIHNMNPGPGGYNYIFGVMGPTGAGYGFMFQNGQLCITSGDHSGGGLLCLPNQASTYPDVVVRYQRDLTNSVILFDAFDYQSGTLLSSQTLAMNQPQGNLALQPTGLFIRNSSVIVDIAWVKWYSSLVPSGSPPPLQSVPADLGNWEFGDGALGNQSTDGDAVAISLSHASFTPTPTYPPSCNAGSQMSLRAGYPAQLDGTASRSGDESPLSYLWQQTSTSYANLPDITMQRLRWSSHTVAQPTITGLVFGPANFQLTVTQGDGQTATCTVDDGAVATDNNATVIMNTPNVALDTAVQNLIGPMVQFGKNPWQFYDQSAYSAAVNRIADLNVDYYDYWDVPGPGTVSVTVGSTEIDGTGTFFSTDVCQGPANPTVPKPGAYIILWYQTGRAINGVAETGRVRLYIGSCDAGTPDTKMYIHTTGCCGLTQWGQNGSHYPPNTGLQLNYTTWAVASSKQAGVWDNNYSPGPANFYDNVQGLYALYFRSGIDTFLSAARTFADRFWTCVQIDRGMAFTYPGGLSFQGPGRPNSMSGLTIRALDTGDRHPDMWTGMHLVDQYNSVAQLVSWAYYLNLDRQVGIVDPREWGYILAQTGYCALYDQSTTHDAPGSMTWQQYCRNALATSFSSTPGTGVWPVALDPGLNAWVMYSANRSSLGTSSSSGNDTSVSWYGSMVNLTNNSTMVSCAATNCGFNPLDFKMYGASTLLSPGIYTPCTTGTECIPFPVLFYIGGASQPWSQPHDSTYTDNQVYCYPTPCTYIDSNHFMLDRPYQGITGQHGWIMGIWEQIKGVTVTNGGDGYSASPTVTITDSAGIGSEATAQATVSGGAITGITVTNAGKGYMAPVVTITDATGSGATATASVIAQGDTANSNMVGFGATTYMEGILGWAFSLAGQAMACSVNGNPPGCSEAVAAQADSYAVMAGEFQLNTGLVPAPTSGASYFGAYPACQTPPTSTDYICTHGESTMAMREIQADGSRGIVAAYLLETNPTTKAALATAQDNWYAGMWAKPGVGTPPVSSPDGTWETSFDATGCTVNSTWQATSSSAGSLYSNCPPGQAYYLTSSPGAQNKYFGQMFGISDMAAWPTLRIGGPLPGTMAVLYVSGRIKDVPGAAMMQVTVTEPTGIVDAPVVCSSSPCAVSVNKTIGNPTIQISYLNLGGKALSVGQPFTLNMNY